MMLGARTGAWTPNGGNMGNLIDIINGVDTSGVLVDRLITNLSHRLFGFGSINVQHATLENCEILSISNCFYQSSLIDVNLPVLRTIKFGQQFQNSKSLKTVNLGLCERIEDLNWMFFNCYCLEKVYARNVNYIHNQQASIFAGCNSLTDVYFDSLQSSYVLGTKLLEVNGTYFAPHTIVFHCTDGDVVYDNELGAWKLVQSVSQLGGGITVNA